MPSLRQLDLRRRVLDSLVDLQASLYASLMRSAHGISFSVVVMSLLPGIGPANGHAETGAPASKPSAPSVRVGVCYRMGRSCRHDSVLVEPSKDGELNQGALDVFAEGRFPEPCQGYDHAWHGVYSYPSSVQIPADAEPTCSALPRWPKKVSLPPGQARWNVAPAR